MENQHKKIKGYRDLSQEEIDAMNEVKELSAKAGELVEKLKAAEMQNDPVKLHDQRWISIGATQLQQGFMALTRSIAQPEFF